MKTPLNGGQLDGVRGPQRLDRALFRHAVYQAIADCLSSGLESSEARP